MTVRREKLYLTIFVSGGLELGVKVSSLQMENNTIYLSLLSGVAVPRLSHLYIYSAIYIKRGVVLRLWRTGGLHTVQQQRSSLVCQFLLSAIPVSNISTIDDTAILDITSCSLVDCYQRYEGNFCLLFQVRRFSVTEN